MSFTDDFTYYYFQGGKIQTARKCSEVPDDVEFCKISDAVRFVQKNGCVGVSQHKTESEYHALCLEVLKIAVEKYGETFPVLFRGTRSNRCDSEYKILFGTTDIDVARFYGEVKQYSNQKGLLTRSNCESVVTEDYSTQDVEVIFFPQ